MLAPNKGVIWKNDWLSQSETFIRDQMASMNEWDFIRLGYHHTEVPLVQADYAPYGRSVLGRALRLTFKTSLFRSQYLRRIRRFDASVIHAHFLSGGVATVPLGRALDLPIVTTLHNGHLSTYRTAGSARSSASISRWIEATKRRPGAVIAVSNYVADSAVQAGIPSSKIEVIHTGTPIVPTLVSEGRRGIVYVGRLIEIKGVFDLLEAVHLFPRSLRDTPVTIVGEGPLKDPLEKRARELGLHVKFTGWLDSSEVRLILAKHRVFCAPSKASPVGSREGFGTVFLEAALQELPCVAYASGGVVDAVDSGQTGVLVPENDVLALSNALQSILDDEDMAAELGQNGRHRAEQQFDIVAQSKLVQDLLSSF